MKTEYRNNSLVMDKAMIFNYSSEYHEIQDIADLFIHGDKTYAEVLEDLIPERFVLWSQIYLPLTEQDKEKSQAYLHNINSTTYFSSSVENSEHVVYSYDVQDSSDVLHSANVSNSTNVELSNYVFDSNDVFSSDGVKRSSHIFYSNNVEDSMNISSSHAVYNSKYVFTSNNIKDSQLIQKCEEVENSILCQNLKNAKNHICCNLKSSENFAILNKEVDERAFERCQQKILKLFQKTEWPLLKKTDNGYGYYREVFNENDKVLYLLMNDVFPFTLTQEDKMLLYNLIFCEKVILKI